MKNRFSLESHNFEVLPEPKTTKKSETSRLLKISGLARKLAGSQGVVKFLGCLAANTGVFASKTDLKSM